MSNTVVKHDKFSSEPMDNKPISDIPGLGPAMAKKLNEIGYNEASDVYQQLCKLRFDKSRFRVWMKTTCKGGRFQPCYDALMSWHRQFGETDTNDASNTMQRENPKRSISRAIKTGGVDKPRASVKFNIDESEANTAFRVPTKTDPVTSFFLAMSETVKTFPPYVFPKVKSQIFQIVNEFEDKFASQHIEPVASTSIPHPQGVNLTMQNEVPNMSEIRLD